MIVFQFILAILATVEAKHAFTNLYVAAGLAAAFAGTIAQFAIGAFVLVFTNSPNSKPTKDAEQRTERTNESAVESGDNEVKKNGCEENQKYQPCPLIKARRC